MLTVRIGLIVTFLVMLAAIFFQWHLINGFDPLDMRWWVWLMKATRVMALPEAYSWRAIWTAAVTLPVFLLLQIVAARPFSRTRGKFAADNLHGNARWATPREIKKAGLLAEDGVVLGKVDGKILRHNGPEHVGLIGPTRCGKGVSNIIPTLQTWQGSVLVLDIKGENFRDTAGYRAHMGHRVLCFHPTAIEALSKDSNRQHSALARFNPLSEVRVGTPHVVRDVQNIVQVLLEPTGSGHNKYWEQEGAAWLSGVIVHVIVKIERTENRRANLADVNSFLKGRISDDATAPPSGGVAKSEQEKLEGQFLKKLLAMQTYEHGDALANKVVREAVQSLVDKGPQERAGVHGNAVMAVSLWVEPIIAANTAVSDFTIDDMMNGEKPLSLYLVIPSGDIERFRPLLRLVLNVILKRLMESGGTAGHGKAYKHRLLLLLDEFASIGKMEIFATAPAFMAGYGIKCFFILQSLEQQAIYATGRGDPDPILMNCDCQVYYTPNNHDTAHKISQRLGKTTVIKESRNRSGHVGAAFSISDSQTEVSRDLMAGCEIGVMPKLHKVKTLFGKEVFKPGAALIFCAGRNPIYATQHIYFQDKELQARTCITAPPL